MTTRLALISGMLWGTALLGIASCDSEGLGGTTVGECTQPQQRCFGTEVQQCGDDSYFHTAYTCSAGRYCDDTLGCTACLPNTTTCVGTLEVHSCAADGTIGPVTQNCNFGQACSGGVCVDACELAASEFVYLVDQSNNLLSFEPRKDTDPTAIQLIGKLNCPSGAATPFSMGVDRTARAWVLFNDGNIFWVSPKDASCTASGYTPGQLGFNTFGMGFSADAQGSKSESLYVGSGPGFGSKGLGKIDPMTQMLSKVADFSATIPGSPEMTGTAAAELYGYFPSATAGQNIIGRINKSTAALDITWQLPALTSSPQAWAFAHWGGRYYQFVTTGGDNQVIRYDPTTGMNVVVQDMTPYKVVGAGVSTCAPLVPG